jgi:hypothetical protein
LGISPGNDKSTTEKQKWLDRCMDYITDDKGKPLVRFHGFGVTAVPLMLRYPWYSVDSTSWIILAANGKILFPRYKSGVPHYSLNPMHLGISDLSPSQYQKNQHYKSLNQSMREVVEVFVREKGYVYGKSEYKICPRDYELEENERWVKKPKKDEKEGRVEVIITPGLSNDYRLRAVFNAEYMMQFEKHNQIEYFELKTKTKKLFVL